MNLGLPDILTTQQVDKRDFKRSESVPRDRRDVVNNDNNFKSHLEEPQKTKQNLSVGINVEKKENVIKLGIENSRQALDNASDSDSDLKNINISNLPNNFIPNGLNKDILEKIVGKIENIESINITSGQNPLLQSFGKASEITKNFIGSKEGKVVNLGKDFGNNVLNSLLSLQETEGLSTQVVPVGDIVKNFGEAVSSASNELAQAGLQTKKPPTTLLTGNTTFAPEVPLKELSKDVLQQQANIQQISDLGTFEEGDITKIAVKSIEVAKNQAEIPNVLPTDVKSGQIESLLGAGTQEGQKNKQKENATNNSQNNSEQYSNKAANSSTDAQILSQKLHNNKISANKANLATNANESSVQNGLLKNDSGATPFKNDTDLLSQTPYQKTNDPLAFGGDFIKFQKYINSASNNVSNIAAPNTGKVDDVLAQIKFGISSLGTKGDSKISIQLHPKELGSVDVRMEVGNDGKTKVAIMAEKTDTLNLLQKEAGSLKGLLQDALQTQSSDLSFSFHQQNDQKWKDMIQEAFNSSYDKEDNNAEDIANVATTYGVNMTLEKGLDIRV